MPSNLTQQSGEFPRVAPREAGSSTGPWRSAPRRPPRSSRRSPVVSPRGHGSTRSARRGARTLCRSCACAAVVAAQATDAVIGPAWCSTRSDAAGRRRYDRRPRRAPSRWASTWRSGDDETIRAPSRQAPLPADPAPRRSGQPPRGDGHCQDAATCATVRRRASSWTQTASARACTTRWKRRDDQKRSASTRPSPPRSPKGLHEPPHRAALSLQAWLRTAGRSPTTRASSPGARRAPKYPPTENRLAAGRRTTSASAPSQPPTGDDAAMPWCTPRPCGCSKNSAASPTGRATAAAVVAAPTDSTTMAAPTAADAHDHARRRSRGRSRWTPDLDCRRSRSRADSAPAQRTFASSGTRVPSASRRVKGLTGSRSPGRRPRTAQREPRGEGPRRRRLPPPPTPVRSYALCAWGILLGIRIARRDNGCNRIRAAGSACSKPYDPRYLRWDAPPRRRSCVPTRARSTSSRATAVGYRPRGSQPGDDRRQLARVREGVAPVRRWSLDVGRTGITGRRSVREQPGMKAVQTVTAPSLSPTHYLSGDTALVPVPKARRAVAKTWEMFRRRWTLRPARSLWRSRGRRPGPRCSTGRETGATLHGQVRGDLIRADGQRSRRPHDQSIVDLRSASATTRLAPGRTRPTRRSDEARAESYRPRRRHRRLERVLPEARCSTVRPSSDRRASRSRTRPDVAACCLWFAHRSPAARWRRRLEDHDGRRQFQRRCNAFGLRPAPPSGAAARGGRARMIPACAPTAWTSPHRDRPCGLKRPRTRVPRAGAAHRMRRRP